MSPPRVPRESQGIGVRRTPNDRCRTLSQRGRQRRVDSCASRRAGGPSGDLKMRTLKGRSKPADVDDVFTGSRRIELDWPGLAAKYAWLPPYEGAERRRRKRRQTWFHSTPGA